MLTVTISDNLRYSVGFCLYGFAGSEKASSPCEVESSCLSLKEALLDGDLKSVVPQPYGYCDADNGAFERATIEACTSCLQVHGAQKYLANCEYPLYSSCRPKNGPASNLDGPLNLILIWAVSLTKYLHPVTVLTALHAGCEQRPEPGTILGLTGDLFSPAGVNMTEPPVPKSDGTSLSVGAIAGIAIGAAVLVLGATALFIVYSYRQRTLCNDSRNPGTKPLPGAADSYNSHIPDHKRSVSFHSETETSNGGLGGHGHGQSAFFSSNTDYYDKMEEVVQIGMAQQFGSGNRKKYTDDRHNGSLNPSSALPAHPAYIPRFMPRSNASSPGPTPTTVANTRASAASRSEPSKTITTIPTVLDNRIASRQGCNIGARPPSLQNISGHHKSSSYTLHKYLSTPDDTHIPIPPPPPITSSSILSQKSQESQNSRRSNFTPGAVHGTMTSQGLGTSGITLFPLPPPPSGPPPAKKSSWTRKPKHEETAYSCHIPRLSIPLVSRIKMPKTYSPPRIFVNGATPVEVKNITGPVDLRSSMLNALRFKDFSNGGNSQTNRVVEFSVPRPAWRRHEVEEVQTSRSSNLF